MGLSSSESEFIVGKEALDGVNPLSGNVPSWCALLYSV
jgi:hypothetical protein